MRFIKQNAWGFATTGAAAAILIFGIALVYQNYRKEAAVPQYAKDFTLNDFSGRAVSLSMFKGQPVILNFWQASCIFCRYEMPILEEASRRYSEAGLVVLGVHRTSRENLASGRVFASELKITYPLLIDEDAKVYEFYSNGILAIPVTVFIGRDGITASTIYGSRSKADFARLIEQFMEQNK